MPKTKISEFSATPGNNTDIDGINIAEGCAPSGINDAIRELMAQLKDFQAGTAGDSFNGPVGTITAAAGAFTNLSASGTFALTGDQVQISEGGTGQTTANAAFNALAPSQTSNAGKYLKTDGTNTSWDALDISTADITGTLPVANGGTGVTSSTGTGSVVLSASPTFTGTVNAAALTLSGAATLNGGTANGIAYLNGSKVLTTGSALTFDGTNWKLGNPTTVSGYKAQIYGDLLLSSGAFGAGQTYTLSLGDGNAFMQSENGQPIAFGAYNGFKWGFASSDNKTINTEWMRLTSTGLGIGTSSPSQKLEVAGSVLLNPTNPALAFNTLAYQVYKQGTSLRLYANSIDHLTCDGTGSVGIGTSSPNVGGWGKAITLQGASNAAFEVTDGTVRTSLIAAGGSAGYVSTDTNHPLIFRTNGTERARITSGGDFYIGTTTNYGRLTVQTDGTNGSVGFIRNTDNAFATDLDFMKSRGSTASPTAVQDGDGLSRLRVAPYQGSAYTYLNIMAVQVDGTYTSGQNPPTRIIFSTNAANGSSTERARITSAGDFIQTANTTAPTLSTNGTVGIQRVSNTELKILMRGSDGVTRSVTLTLA